MAQEAKEKEEMAAKAAEDGEEPERPNSKITNAEVAVEEPVEAESNQSERAIPLTQEEIEFEEFLA